MVSAAVTLKQEQEKGPDLRHAVDFFAGGAIQSGWALSNVLHVPLALPTLA